MTKFYEGDLVYIPYKDGETTAVFHRYISNKIADVFNKSNLEYEEIPVEKITSVYGLGKVTDE